MESTNQLSIIVQNSNLEPIEAQSILEKLNAYEDVARDWESKAKAIVVTNKSQTAEMRMAREGRLFLAQKRIDVEKARKALKEQSLRKGQAIDAIAKFLTSLIEPIEKYLKEQEDFVKIQEEKEVERLRIEAETKAEAERIVKEKADREEQARIRLEIEKLKKEAKERERVIAEERENARKEREAEELEKKRIEIEHQRNLEAERKERERVEAELQAKKDAEEKARLELEEAKRLAELQPEKDKFASYIEALLTIDQPNLNNPELRSKLNAIREYLVNLKL